MFVVSTEVRDAVATGRPVVALESTIFTHGLPRPRNLEVAREAEARLRDNGVVPATIGVVDGVPTIGLSDDQIELLSNEDDAVKVSVRDLPVAAVKGLSGGTTVAATALLAHKAGIEVFSTGGLGGVHEGAGTSFDESADLFTLADVPILVVSAGAKSILDISATLERLESLSIPVVGYRTNRYPGFYVADSGHEIDFSVADPREAAAMARARRELDLRAALLIANPVPEDEQLPPELHDRVVAEAWQAAREQNIVGQDTTPFLLDHIVKATGGRSLEVNIAVYRNNVSLGAEIAKAMGA
ncbi:pseudouridine-5'-phosphate glycosidase [Saccharopolyspora terrae]|uniref:Pseudouridine-5'-phosphate glycosidase n=1 Tax=Saccharopolyspora terrae TaxID=2530384 RepID=A0A4R4VS49_9PSEU|nr:pseudouridine-5'-phosphate glycosidase [Saccharopolyspora terrae]TDD05165.1 pseudouridine-5'-phosphate glycosidase [Saccharopolyspora terrae]